MASRRSQDDSHREFPFQFEDQGRRPRDNEGIGYNLSHSQSRSSQDSRIVGDVPREGPQQAGYQTMNVGTANEGGEDGSLQRVLHLVQQQYKALGQQTQGQSYSTESLSQNSGMQQYEQTRQTSQQGLGASGESSQYGYQQQKGQQYEQNVTYGRQDAGDQVGYENVNQMVSQMQLFQQTGGLSQADVIQQQKSLIEKQLVTGNVDPMTMIQLGEMHQKLCQLQRRLQQELKPASAAQSKSSNRNVNRGQSAEGKGQMSHTEAHPQVAQWQQSQQQIYQPENRHWQQNQQDAAQQRNQQLIYKLQEQYDRVNEQNPKWQGIEQNRKEASSETMFSTGRKRSPSPYYTTEQRMLDAQAETLAVTVKRRRMSPRYETSLEQKYTDLWEGDHYARDQTRSAYSPRHERSRERELSYPRARGDQEAYGWPDDMSIEGQLKEMRALTSPQPRDTRVVRVVKYSNETMDSREELYDIDRDNLPQEEMVGRDSDFESDDEISQLEAARIMKDRLERRLKSGKISQENERKYRDMYFDLSDQIDLLEQHRLDDYHVQEERSKSPDEYFYEYKDEWKREKRRSDSRERRRDLDDDYERRHYDDRIARERRRRSSSPSYLRSHRRERSHGRSRSSERRSTRSSECKPERREKTRHEKSPVSHRTDRSESAHRRDRRTKEVHEKDDHKSKTETWQVQQSANSKETTNKYPVSGSSQIPVQYGRTTTQSTVRSQQQPPLVSPQATGPSSSMISSWQGYSQPTYQGPMQPGPASFPRPPQPAPSGMQSPAAGYVPVTPGQSPYQVGCQTTVSVNYQYQTGSQATHYRYQYSAYGSPQNAPSNMPVSHQVGGGHTQWPPVAWTANQPAVRPVGPPGVQSPADHEAKRRKIEAETQQVTPVKRSNLVKVSTQVLPKKPPEPKQKCTTSPVLIDVQKLQAEKAQAKDVHTALDNTTKKENEGRNLAKRKEKRKTLLSSKTGIMTNEMFILAPNVEERLKKVFSYNHLYKKFCLLCCEQVPENVNQPTHLELSRHAEMQSVFKQIADMWGIVKEFGKREKESRAEVLKKSKIVEKKILISKPDSDQCYICSVEIKDKQEYESHITTLRHEVLKHMCEIVVKVKKAVLRKDMDAIENLLQEEKDKVSSGEEDRQCKLCKENMQSDEEYEKHVKLSSHLTRRVCINIIMDALQHLIKSTLVINIKRIPVTTTDPSKKNKAKSSPKDREESKASESNVQVTSSGGLVSKPAAGSQKADFPKEFVHMSIEEKLDKVYIISNLRRFCVICQEFLPKSVKQASHAKQRKHRGMRDFFQMLIKMGGFIEDFSKPEKEKVLVDEMARIRDMLEKGVSFSKLYCAICRTSFTEQEKLKSHAGEMRHRLLQATYEVVLKVETAIEKGDKSAITELVKSYERVTKICKDPVRRGFIEPITRSLKILHSSNLVKSMPSDESQGADEETDVIKSCDTESIAEQTANQQTTANMSQPVPGVAVKDPGGSLQDSENTCADNYQSQIESVKSRFRKTFTYELGERYCLVCCDKIPNDVTQSHHLTVVTHTKMLATMDNIAKMKRIIEDFSNPDKKTDALSAAKNIEQRLVDPKYADMYCAVCDELIKKWCYDRHIYSVIHKQLKGISEVVVKVRKAVEREDVQDIESLLQTYEKKLNFKDVEKRPWFCTLCGLDCLSKVAYEEHIRCRHHLVGTMCKDAILQALHYHCQHYPSTIKGKSTRIQPAKEKSGSHRTGNVGKTISESKTGTSQSTSLDSVKVKSEEKERLHVEKESEEGSKEELDKGTEELHVKMEPGEGSKEEFDKGTEKLHVKMEPEEGSKEELDKETEIQHVKREPEEGSKELDKGTETLHVKQLPESKYVPIITLEKRLKKTFTYKLGDRYCLICCEKVPEKITPAKHLSLVQHRQMHHMLDSVFKMGKIIEDFSKPEKIDDALARTEPFEKRLLGGVRQQKYYCAVCRISCSGTKAAKVFSIHMKTVSHEQTKETCETLMKVKNAVIEKDMSAIQKLVETHEEQLIGKETEDGPWSCLICKLEYDKQYLYQHHVAISRPHAIRKICKGSILHSLRNHCQGSRAEAGVNSKVKTLVTEMSAPQGQSEGNQSKAQDVEPQKLTTTSDTQGSDDISQPIKTHEIDTQKATSSVTSDSKGSGDIIEPMETEETDTQKHSATVTSDAQESGDTSQPIRTAEVKTSDAAMLKGGGSESSAVTEKEVVIKIESKSPPSTMTGVTESKHAVEKPYIEYAPTQTLEERLKKTFIYKLGDRYCLICCEKVPENITPVKHVRFFRHTQMRAMLESISNMGTIIEDLSKPLKKDDALDRAKTLEEKLQNGASRTDYHCAACQETCSGKQAYAIHMKSIGHEQIRATSNAVIQVKNAVQQNEVQSIDLLVQKYEGEVKLNADGNKPLFCSVCALECKDKSAYVLHMTSSRHHMIRKVCKERVLSSLRCHSQQNATSTKTGTDIEQASTSTETADPLVAGSTEKEKTPEKEKPSAAKQKYENSMITIFKKTMPKLSRYYRGIFDDVLELLQVVAHLAQPNLKKAAWAKIYHIERNLEKGLQGRIGKCFICDDSDVSRKEIEIHKNGKRHSRLRYVSEIIVEVKKIMEKNEIRKIPNLIKKYHEKLHMKSSSDVYWLCAVCDIFCDNVKQYRLHLRDPVHTLCDGTLQAVVTSLRYLHAELRPKLEQEPSTSKPPEPSTSKLQQLTSTPPVPAPSRTVPMLPVETRLQKVFVYILGKRYCLVCCEVVSDKIYFKDHISHTKHKAMQHTFSRMVEIGDIIEKLSHPSTRHNAEEAANDIKNALEVEKNDKGACNICHQGDGPNEKCDELHFAGLMHHRIRYAYQAVAMVVEAIESGDLKKLGDWIKVQTEPVIQNKLDVDGHSKLTCRICNAKLKSHDAYEHHVVSSLHVGTNVCMDTILRSVDNFYKSEYAQTLKPEHKIRTVTPADGNHSSTVSSGSDIQEKRDDKSAESVQEFSTEKDDVATSSEPENRKICKEKLDEGPAKDTGPEAKSDVGAVPQVTDESGSGEQKRDEHDKMQDELKLDADSEDNDEEMQVDHTDSGHDTMDVKSDEEQVHKEEDDDVDEGADSTGGREDGAFAQVELEEGDDESTSDVVRSDGEGEAGEGDAEGEDDDEVQEEIVSSQNGVSDVEDNEDEAIEEEEEGEEYMEGDMEELYSDFSCEEGSDEMDDYDDYNKEEEEAQDEDEAQDGEEAEEVDSNGYDVSGEMEEGEEQEVEDEEEHNEEDELEFDDDDDENEASEEGLTMEHEEEEELDDEGDVNYESEALSGDINDNDQDDEDDDDSNDDDEEQGEVEGQEKEGEGEEKCEDKEDGKGQEQVNAKGVENAGGHDSEDESNDTNRQDSKEIDQNEYEVTAESEEPVSVDDIVDVRHDNQVKEGQEEKEDQLKKTDEKMDTEEQIKQNEGDEMLEDRKDEKTHEDDEVVALDCGDIAQEEGMETENEGNIVPFKANVLTGSEAKKYLNNDTEQGVEMDDYQGLNQDERTEHQQESELTNDYEKDTSEVSDDVEMKNEKGGNLQNESDAQKGGSSDKNVKTRSAMEESDEMQEHTDNQISEKDIEGGCERQDDTTNDEQKPDDGNVAMVVGAECRDGGKDNSMKTICDKTHNERTPSENIVLTRSWEIDNSVTTNQDEKLVTLADGETATVEDKDDGNNVEEKDLAGDSSLNENLLVTLDELCNDDQNGEGDSCDDDGDDEDEIKEDGFDHSDGEGDMDFNTLMDNFIVTDEVGEDT